MGSLTCSSSAAYRVRTLLIQRNGAVIFQDLLSKTQWLFREAAISHAWSASNLRMVSCAIESRLFSSAIRARHRAVNWYFSSNVMAGGSGSGKWRAVIAKRVEHTRLGMLRNL